jgi:hypothetical protein
VEVVFGRTGGGARRPWSCSRLPQGSTIPALRSLPHSDSDPDSPIPSTVSAVSARARASPRLSPSTHQAVIVAWAGFAGSSLSEASRRRVSPAEGRKGGYGVLGNPDDGGGEIGEIGGSERCNWSGGSDDSMRLVMPSDALDALEGGRMR